MNRLPTLMRFEAALVSDEKIRQRAMNMGTDLLSRFRSSKDTYDRHLRCIFLLRRAMRSEQRWVELSGMRLVMINTIESEAKSLHHTQLQI